MADGRPAAGAWPRLLPFLPALAAGLALRLYLLPDQVLLDDEWHSLNFVIDKPLSGVLFRQGLGANTLPQNLYSFLLLHTTGWSEPLLRLPSVACGALSLVVLPLMVRRLWSERAAVFFSCLLAVSPCLVFYSRLTRPYAAVAFFGMVSLLSLYRWVREGGRSHGVAYAVSGFLAVYLHLYAAFFVVPPLLCLAAWRLLRGLAVLPSYAALARAAALLFGLSAVFILPANLANPWWLDFKGAQDSIGWPTLREYWSLVSGSTAAAWQVLLLGLAAAGLYRTLRDDFVVGVLMCCSLAAFALRIATSHQPSISAGILLARFGIISLPLVFLLASLAWARLLEKGTSALPEAAARAAGVIAGAGLAAALWLLGPLPGIYRRPNNFTNHSAYQNDYTPADWSRSRQRGSAKGLMTRREDIPAFYASLAADPGVRGIIEYPMMVGDHLDPYYYYQHFHHRPVAIGYVSSARFPPLPSRDDFVYGDTPVDYVLSRLSAGRVRAPRFRNIVALDDWDRVRESFAGWAVVVHHDLGREAFPGKVPRDAAQAARVQQAAQVLKSRGALVVHRSEPITVLTIPRRPGSAGAVSP